MGNIPMPFSGLGLNSWTLEKKLLIWRTIALSTCIIGTGLYCSPLEPYLEIPYFGILVPTLITGYIFIHICDILLLVMKQDHHYTFLNNARSKKSWSRRLIIIKEFWFVSNGAAGSLICGVYQLYKWCSWMFSDSGDDYDIPELLLALAFIFHFICLCAAMIHRKVEHGRLSNAQTHQ